MLRAAYFSQEVSYQKYKLETMGGAVHHELTQRISAVIPFSHLETGDSQLNYFLQEYLL